MTACCLRKTKSRKNPSIDHSTGPVAWRIVLMEKDDETSVVDEIESEDFARNRLRELRELAWPVQLEEVSRKPAGS